MNTDKQQKLEQILKLNKQLEQLTELQVKQETARAYASNEWRKGKNSIVITLDEDIYPEVEITAFMHFLEVGAMQTVQKKEEIQKELDKLIC